MVGCLCPATDYSIESDRIRIILEARPGFMHDAPMLFGRKRFLLYARACVRAVAWLIVPLLVSCSSLPWQRSAYEVTLTGIDDQSLRNELFALSEAWQNRNNPAVNTGRLTREFRADTFNMERYLHAVGFSNARVTLHTVTNGRRPALEFVVVNTNRYTISDVKVVFPGVDEPDLTGWTNNLSGQPVVFSAIDLSGRQLVRSRRNAGFPQARAEDKVLYVDHSNHTADVVFTIAPGSPAVMGGHSVSGLRRVDPAFIERRVNWKPGQPFRQDTMDVFSRRLTTSGLFSFVDISSPNPTSDIYDVAIRLQERRRRTVGVGLGYQSDTGFETTFSWQHRNLFGMGERLELDATYGEELWLGSAMITLPDIRQSGNDLELGIDAADEQSDAYDVLYQKVYGRIRHRAGREWTLLYGPALRNSTVNQLDKDENYIQVSLPFSAAWNRRNNILDPTRGFALTLSTEPFYDLDSSDTFIKSLATPAVYVPVIGETLTMGLRLTVGSISGTSIDRIPADQRFYAGGGQSIRGYAYQSVGPRTDNQPVGGLSLVESSVELRWRATQRIGLVAFIDGGSAYEPEISDFSESYQWGAGLGFRYFTGVGPIRIDIGVPVNPRDDIDNDFEFYISIGQAF